MGNSDAHTLRHNYLDQPVTARFIRLHVLRWFRHPSLRLEIVGCQGNLKYQAVKLQKQSQNC
jgi:hypothetical protein